MKVIRPVTADEYAAIAEIFLSARKTAMPWLKSPHTDDDVRGWFREHYPLKYRTFVAEVDGEVAGFAGLSDGWLDHLYLSPDHWRQGLGRQLFERVKEEQPSGFVFWVFQKNENARQFYEAMGCRLVEKTNGQGNMELEPDCRYEWRP
jgi:GNAT superfamily N-acetyltransferase